MNGITTHVLDTSRGRPAAGVPVTLERLTGAEWTIAAAGRTDDDGRLIALAGDTAPGTYRLVFDTAAYFRSNGVRAFFPEVTVAFEIDDVSRHYHVPVLLSPYGYSTYRGS